MLRKTNIQAIKDRLEQQLHSSSDIEYRKLRNGHVDIDILYIKSICDDMQIYTRLTKPFYSKIELYEFEAYLKSEPVIAPFESEEKVIQQLLHGNVVIFLPRSIYLFDANKVVNNQLNETTVETTLQGPIFGISEDLPTSLNMIRHRYPSIQLKVEQIHLGTTSKTAVALLYDQEFVDQAILSELKKDLQAIDTKVLQAAGQLQNLLTKGKRTLFPKMMVTERPDRVVLNLTQGKIVMLINGAAFALIVPAVFYDFLTAMDDQYQTYWVARFLVFIRYIGLFIAITVPALYVSISSFNPEIMRVQLTISIAGSRAAVPYPSYLEVIFMLGIMELLTEASIRLPKVIGSTATTVGGLILGQAAQQAGLVSSIMIIVVAAVAISNFVIPINEMSFAIRVLKYFLVGLATLFGIIGLVVGLYVIIVHLVNMRCYGVPFLKVFTSERKVADGTNKEL